MTTNDRRKNLHSARQPTGKGPTDGKIDADGRLRIATFVHAAMGWAGQNTSKKLIGTGKVTRSAIDRIKRGDEVSDTLLRALGDVLDLPRDFLLYIGRGDIDRIERLGDHADDNLRDLIRWTLEHLFSVEPDGPRARSA